MNYYNIEEILRRVEVLRPEAVIDFPFFLTLVMAAGYGVLHRLIVKEKSIFHLAFWVSFIFYGLNVVRLTFFPLPLNDEYNALVAILIDQGAVYCCRNNLQLLDFMKWDNLWYWTTIGNFFLLFPLGIYLPILMKKGNLLKITLAGFLVSLGIEMVQYLLGLYTGYVVRSFDVDDLMLNTLGAVSAYLLFTTGRLFFRAFQKLRRRLV